MLKRTETQRQHRRLHRQRALIALLAALAYTILKVIWWDPAEAASTITTVALGWAFAIAYAWDRLMT